ncbi:MAG: hypothetical protein L3J39_02695 [Verrucomicrobiales bacterium]|nr:hypothetical protein [Verrucomicrobiales bacterium]
MSELVTENDLPKNLKDLYVKGVKAHEVKNYGYAITLFQAVLKDAPNFLDGRKKLRLAAVKQKQGAKKSMSLGAEALKVFKMQGQVKKDPLGVIIEVEKNVLALDPFNAQAGNLLFEAAQAAEMPETAGFALEIVTQGNPTNTKHRHLLGQFYFDQGMYAEAAEIYAKLRQEDSADLVATKMEKDASAQQSMKTQNWEGGMQENLRDKDQTKTLDARNREGMTPEMLQAQVQELSAAYAADQNNLAVTKDLADCFEQLEDWTQAQTYYEWAFSLSRNDPALERKVLEIREKVGKAQLAELQKFVDENPEHPEVERVKAQIAELRGSQGKQLLEEARLQVEKNPTDAQLRFEYGKQLFATEDFTAAIPELQQAKRAPNLRIKAMLMLGKCYEGKNMFDLAVGQFEEAIKEIPGMDDTKKELLYNVGLLYDKMDNREASLEALKQIYAADYGYKDVAQRVEQSYQKSEDGA